MRLSWVKHHSIAALEQEMGDIVFSNHSQPMKTLVTYAKKINQHDGNYFFTMNSSDKLPCNQSSLRGLWNFMDKITLFIKCLMFFPQFNFESTS